MVVPKIASPEKRQRGRKKLETRSVKLEGSESVALPMANNHADSKLENSDSVALPNANNHADSKLENSDSVALPMASDDAGKKSMPMQEGLAGELATSSPRLPPIGLEHCNAVVKLERCDEVGLATSSLTTTTRKHVRTENKQDDFIQCPNCTRQIKHKRNLKRHMALFCIRRENNEMAPLALPASKKLLNNKSVVPPSVEKKKKSSKSSAVSSTGKKPQIDTKSVLPSTSKKHNEVVGTSDNNKTSTDNEPTENAEGSSFQCPTCLKAFKHKRTLLFHIRNECGKSFNCVSCERNFTYMKDLKRHMKHPCGKVWKCSTCNDVFKDEQNFIKHQKYECEKILQCPVCGKVYQRKSSLDRHLALCSNETNSSSSE